MVTSSTDSLQNFGKRHVTKGLGRLTDGIMSKGEGSYIIFEDGRRMLDFTCGIGVTGLGQCVLLGENNYSSPNDFVGQDIAIRQ